MADDHARHAITLTVLEADPPGQAAGIPVGSAEIDGRKVELFATLDGSRFTVNIGRRQFLIRRDDLIRALYAGCFRGRAGRPRQGG